MNIFSKHLVFPCYYYLQAFYAPQQMTLVMTIRKRLVL